MQNQKLSTLIGIFSFVVLTTCVMLIIAQDNKTNVKFEDVALNSAENNNGDINITNKTRSVEITGTEIVNQKLRLSLKNISYKSINCLYLTIGEDSTLRYDFAYSEEKSKITSLEHYILFIPIDKEMSAQGLILRGVLFVDDTGDGEASYVNEMKNIRRGERLKIAEGLRIVQNLISESQNLSDLDFEKLKEKFLSLQTTDPRETSHGINEGKHWGKQQLLRYIEQALKENDKSVTNNRLKMSELKSKLEKLVGNSPLVGGKQ
jgi:hypothetical protein